MAAMPYHRSHCDLLDCHNLSQRLAIPCVYPVSWLTARRLSSCSSDLGIMEVILGVVLPSAPSQRG